MSQKLNALTHGLAGFIQTHLTKHLKLTGTSAPSTFSTPPPTPPRIHDRFHLSCVTTTKSVQNGRIFGRTA